MQFFDANGNPLVGGKVFTYAAGTTTLKASYTDSSGSAPADNPVILDSAGRATIWIDGSYKIVVKNSMDVTISTTDNLTSFINNTTGGTTLTNTTLNNPTISGGTADNIVIGNSVPSTVNATLVTSTGGMAFGNTTVASTTVLDWYQEGTFTPQLQGLTVPGTATYTQQFGKYTRIGNMVSFQINLSWTGHTGTGGAYVASLPFSNIGVANVVNIENNNYATTGSTVLTGNVDANTITISLLQTTITTGATAPAAVDAAANLYISGTYFVN